MRLPCRETLAVHQGTHRAVFVVALHPYASRRSLKIYRFVSPEAAARQGHTAPGGGDGIMRLNDPWV